MKKIRFILFLAFLPIGGLAQLPHTDTFDSNFAHVVYFWFHDPDNSDDRIFFEDALKSFLGNSKYAKTNFIGTPPEAVRDVVDDSFTYNLILTFGSAQDQASYQVEEAHLEFIEACKHLWRKVIVYDAKGIKQ